ncbi:GNAT family N-acetyltransferase [Hymenobacter busanensis]|uniref:GNAT family N-acetyltransferase n=1 Tax=Hymenobacter busanensis TaxID=2607656 RepID=A0A7L4ZYE8_9BACT|nr:GNAT family N-acetyltransferase [Hymenobacter busanensis]KAA9332411.1 GNAT family N-acetyltransferase [Hymenobacter busanensis]QHJ07252.1 GNAT family N-acetyltransferase [Hymenobacter busanensis]
MPTSQSAIHPAVPDPAAVVQPATLADIPVIIELAEATWEPTYRFIISKEQIDYMYRVIYTPASLRQQMTDDGHSFLLLHVDGHPAGYASFSPRPEEPGVYKLHKLYLLPSHQGRGLGQQLMQAVEDGVRAAGGQWLELNVNRHNPALHFYERQGFQQHRTEDIPIGPYWMNDYVMRKALTPPAA